MPKLSEETSERRRNQILEAALRCFAREGLHATSMADLFEESGMSAGSVYSWFASKDDIIEAAYRGSGAPHAARMASVLERDPLAGIAEVLRTAAGMFEDPRWQMISRVNLQLWGEALVNERIRASFLDDFHAYRRLLTDAVRRAQRNGDLDPELSPETVALVLWGTYLGMEAQKAWEPDLDTNKYVETALALLFPTKFPSEDATS